MALSTALMSCPRVPSESSAPALISDSITRLFITRRSTFSQNSQKLLKRPPTSSRAFRMDSMALPPTFFTAARPKRIAALAVRRELRARNLHVRRLDAMPISRHSPMYFTTLSGFEVSDVSSAAMNSTG